MVSGFFVCLFCVLVLQAVSESDEGTASRDARGQCEVMNLCCIKVWFLVSDSNPKGSQAFGASSVSLAVYARFSG
jgi:hypothetical protein